LRRPIETTPFYVHFDAKVLGAPASR
jgi:hypothetical protein